MKKIISIMLAVLLCFGSMSVVAFAADRDATETKTETKTDVKTGSITDKAKWSYDDSTKTLSITGTGAMKDYSKSSEAPWAAYASAIKTVSIAEGITSIGKNAFSGLTALTGVTIPASVTVISDSAFEGCLALAGATIPASVTTIAAKAFYGCTALKTLTVSTGSKLVTIGAFAFANCAALTAVKLLEGFANLENSAFLNAALTSITLPKSTQKIGASALAVLDVSKLHIYYAGTEADKAAMKIEKATDGSDYLSTASWHYSSSETSTNTNTNTNTSDTASSIIAVITNLLGTLGGSDLTKTLTNYINAESISKILTTIVNTISGSLGGDNGEGSDNAILKAITGIISPDALKTLGDAFGSIKSIPGIENLLPQMLNIFTTLLGSLGNTTA